MAGLGPPPASRTAPLGAAEAVDWQAAIAQHGRRVVVALLARGVALERARELAQETWLRLMERHREGRLREVKLPGLAIAQALFLAQDDARKERVRSGGAGPASAGTESVFPAASVEQALIDRQALSRAAGALAGCSPAARRVFDFCYRNPQLGHAEAAARLGLSTQRVRQSLCEVRKVLRRAIEDDGHDHD